MGLVTKDWSATTYQRGVAAHEEYLATGFNDAEAARSAIPIQPLSGFSLDNRLLAGMPEAKNQDGPQNFRFSVDYSLHPISGDGTTSLLNTPPQYFPDVQESKEPIDRDVFGNPITNSAGDPPKENLTNDVISIFYTYERYEAFYDGAKAFAYTNTVNSDDVILPGFGRVLKGKAKCKSIRVAEKFNRNALAVKIVYALELRDDGFKIRIPDKGRRGWSATSEGAYIDDIYFTNGDTKKQVSEDVLLDGFGTPIDKTNYAIGESLGTPIPHGIYVNGQGQVEQEKTQLAVFLKYTVKKSMPFAGLNLVP